MCGIAGFCHLQEHYLAKESYWETILVSMGESIAHRGPDDTGTYLRPQVGLSHVRLSIRDLAMGHQPMVRQFEGREYAIVYNGEIYNTEELKARMPNVSWETTSDTEVILWGYILFGREFVQELNGIFAFAIWDSSKEELTLYRDQLGVKPLFYTFVDNTLVFGSELKALFCHPNVSPKVDDGSFREIFGLGPARSAGNGIFKGGHEIRAGQSLQCNKTGPRRQYT